MTNPHDVIDAVVQTLSAVQELVTLMGSSGTIVGHYHAYPAAASWVDALRQLKPPAILVDYLGKGTGNLGRVPARVHYLRLLTRDGEGVSIYDLIDALDNGKIGNLRWPQSVHSDLLMVHDPLHMRRTIAIDETSSLDYWESTFELTETFSA